MYKKSMVHVQSCCFANKTYCFFWRSRYSPRGGILKSLIIVPVSMGTFQFYSIQRFHSRGQHLGKFIGRRFIVLEHQHGRRDVMWKRSIR